MDIERRAGRIVGAIFIAQMAGSAVLNFRLEAPLFGLHTRKQRPRHSADRSETVAEGSLAVSYTFR